MYLDYVHSSMMNLALRETKEYKIEKIIDDTINERLNVSKLLKCAGVVTLKMLGHFESIYEITVIVALFHSRTRPSWIGSELLWPSSKEAFCEQHQGLISVLDIKSSIRSSGAAPIYVRGLD